jgi:hypothetical protein
MEKFGIEKIRSLGPCYDPGKYLSKDWQGTVVDLLEMDKIPFPDRLWVVCRTEFISERTMRLFAVWCARQVEHLMKDSRSIAALDVAHRFAMGEASEEERDAAGAAAWASARAAARAAAGAAAWASAGAAAWASARASARAAARDAAWAAAGDAAGAAARASARAAAGAAAWASARDAAGAAAWDAAWAAAWAAAGAAARDAAWDAQKNKLIEMIEADEKASAS